MKFQFLVFISIILVSILNSCNSTTEPSNDNLNGIWSEEFFWKSIIADLENPQGKLTTSTLNLNNGEFSLKLSPFDSTYLSFPPPDSSHLDTSGLDTTYIINFPTFPVEKDSFYSGTYSLTKAEITFQIDNYNKSRTYSYLLLGDSLTIGILPGEFNYGEFIWGNSGHKIFGTFKLE